MKQKLETALVLVMGLSAGAANAQVCATQPTCESLGFMQKAADCSGKQLLKCPFDTTKVFCGGDCSSFTLTSCDASKGDCISCGGKYKYTSCNYGWTLSNGNCNPSSCSGYGETSCEYPAASCMSCRSADTTRYRHTRCQSGYSLSSLGFCMIDGNCGHYYNEPTRMETYDVCVGANTGKKSYRAKTCIPGTCACGRNPHIDSGRCDCELFPKPCT